MNYSTQHTASRLDTRGLQYTVDQLAAIAKTFTEDTAVVMPGRVPSPEGKQYGYVKVVLIVRNREPKTVMCRRETQNFSKQNFDVQKVVYL